LLNLTRCKRAQCFIGLYNNLIKEGKIAFAHEYKTLWIVVWSAH